MQRDAAQNKRTRYPDQVHTNASEKRTTLRQTGAELSDNVVFQVEIRSFIFVTGDKADKQVRNKSVKCSRQLLSRTMTEMKCGRRT